MGKGPIGQGEGIFHLMPDAAPSPGTGSSEQYPVSTTRAKRSTPHSSFDEPIKKRDRPAPAAAQPAVVQPASAASAVAAPSPPAPQTSCPGQHAVAATAAVVVAAPPQSRAAAAPAPAAVQRRPAMAVANVAAPINGNGPLWPQVPQMVPTSIPAEAQLQQPQQQPVLLPPPQQQRGQQQPRNTIPPVDQQQHHPMQQPQQLLQGQPQQLQYAQRSLAQQPAMQLQFGRPFPPQQQLQAQTQQQLQQMPQMVQMQQPRQQVTQPAQQSHPAQQPQQPQPHQQMRMVHQHMMSRQMQMPSQQQQQMNLQVAPPQVVQYQPQRQLQQHQIPQGAPAPAPAPAPMVGGGQQLPMQLSAQQHHQMMMQHQMQQFRQFQHMQQMQQLLLVQQRQQHQPQQAGSFGAAGSAGAAAVAATTGHGMALPPGVTLPFATTAPPTAMIFRDGRVGGRRRLAQPWTEAEDKRLLAMVSKHGAHNWRVIAAGIGSRTPAQAAQRWRKTLDPDLVQVKKGKWNSEEDELLKKLVAQHTDKNWHTVAKGFNGTRTVKHCRERWLKHISPGLKSNQPWTLEEDTLLLRLRQQLGYNGWAEIARSLPGRTDNAVKRRYRSLDGTIDVGGAPGML